MKDPFSSHGLRANTREWQYGKFSAEPYGRSSITRIKASLETKSLRFHIQTSLRQIFCDNVLFFPCSITKQIATKQQAIFCRYQDWKWLVWHIMAICDRPILGMLQCMESSSQNCSEKRSVRSLQIHLPSTCLQSKSYFRTMGQV